MTASDLLAWANALPVRIPGHAKRKRKLVCFTAASIVPPYEMETDAIRGRPSGRIPGDGPITIESVHLTAEREAYRALGVLLIGYALSDQAEPLRLHLTASAEEELRQVVLWPSTPSPLDEQLGLRRRVTEVRYLPALPTGNPNYTTSEQDDQRYPRAHLPYARVGSADVEHGGVVLPGEPVCAHITGTAPSLVWLGKFLLNLSMDDNNCRLAYLYNTVPAESLAHGSAELRLVVDSPAGGPLFHPRWERELDSETR